MNYKGKHVANKFIKEFNVSKISLDKDNVERLTKTQFESGDYEPCGTCLP